jgi:hypothetical protein
MKTNDYLFKKESLNTFHIIEEPGTHFVRVNNNITKSHLYEEDDHPRYLVTLKVIHKDNVEKCLSLFGNHEQIPFKNIRPYLYTGVIWENQVLSELDLPIKNEEVIATFNYIDDEIKCISMTLVPRTELNTLQLQEVCKSRKLLNDILKLENG